MCKQVEPKNRIMKKNTTYLTILFLLLILNGCIPGRLPTTAVCTLDAVTMEENFIKLKKFDDIDEPEYDNRVISFTHDQMIENLNYLTAEARKHNIDKEQLGFRVYLGAKAEDEFLGPNEIDSIKGDTKSIKNVDGKYYTTVFFVATLKGNSDDPSKYENVYEIAPLNYGGSRRPPKKYKSNLECQVHKVRH